MEGNRQIDRMVWIFAEVKKQIDIRERRRIFIDSKGQKDLLTHIAVYCIRLVIRLTDANSKIKLGYIMCD